MGGKNKKKRKEAGSGDRQSVTPGAKRSERLSLRAMAHAFIKLFRFCIDLSIGRREGGGGEKKFIDDEIPDLHDASVIRSLSSIKAFESFNRKIAWYC